MRTPKSLHLYVFCSLVLTPFIGNAQDTEEERRRDPHRDEFTGRYSISKTKGERFDFHPYWPVTDKLDNIITSINNDDNEDGKNNFIIFPHFKGGGDTRWMPYVLQWDKRDNKYARKVTVTPGLRYYLIYDPNRNDVAMYSGLSKEDREMNSKIEGLNGFNEYRYIEMHYGYNNSINIQQFQNALLEGKATYNTLFIKKVTHNKNKDGSFSNDQTYVELSFPQVQVPTKIIYKTNGKVIKEEDVYYLNFSAAAEGCQLRNELTHEGGGSFASTDPGSGVWCIPTDGNTFATCLALSRDPVSAMTGHGYEEYQQHARNASTSTCVLGIEVLDKRPCEPV